MIPKAYITEWRHEAPWARDAWVEQDLVISRALVEMYRVPAIAERLAFRGGTALHKLHLKPAPRYSEDIDLVQVQPEPIGEVMDDVRAVLDPWLGAPRRAFKEGRVNLIYRFESEDVPPLRLRLKIEINSREHFAVLGLARTPVEVDSRWFSGAADLTTFHLDELLATKLRALYQRKKGRDLFDLAHAVEHATVDAGTVVSTFGRYLEAEGNSVTRAQFEANLHEKSGDKSFRGDIEPLLRSGVRWDFEDAMACVMREFVSKIPGDPWAGV